MSYFFELGGVSVALHANLEFRQQYRPVVSANTRRMMDGSLNKQSNWTRVGTSLSARGWVPHGLDGLDYSSPLLMKCGAPRAITSASNILTIPAERRADAGYEPQAYAIKNGEQIETSIGIATNTATLGIVVGAEFYQVVYFPEITVYADPPAQDLDVHAAEYGWTLRAEQI